MKNNNGPKLEPWGTPELTGTGSEVSPGYTLVATHQVRAKPLQDAVSKSELVQLLQQAAMVHLIEGIRLIHVDHVHLFSVV